MDTCKWIENVQRDGKWSDNIDIRERERERECKWSEIDVMWTRVRERKRLM